jgi:hypothetical protein
MIRYSIFAFIIFISFSLTFADIINVPYDQPTIQADITSVFAWTHENISDSLENNDESIERLKL